MVGKMDLFSIVISFILIRQTYTLRHVHGLECNFNSIEYDCRKLQKSTLEKITLPTKACIVHPCANCIKAHETFLLDDDTLITPENFILRATNSTSGQNHTSMELIHVSSEKTLKNPTRIVLEICLFDRRTIRSTTGLHRRLLEHESASFKNGNLSLEFNDPILTLPDLGKVILRTEDFENVFTVPDNLQITLPFEVLAFKTTINIIYIHLNGHTVYGQIHISGKNVCQSRTCILCIDFFKHLPCYPYFMSYTIYFISFTFVLLLVWFLKSILKSVLYLLQILCFTFYAIFKILKLFARFCLLLGSYIGTLLNNVIFSFYYFLEHHGAHGAQINLHHIVVIALIMQFDLGSTECNTQAIIQSELESCKTSPDGIQTCELFSTAEISLPTIASETCVLFMDKREQHLFTLQIQLDSVICSFHTKRLYFTFPVTAKHISQVSCIYNEYCGKGIHCIREKIGKEGLKFEAESPESREYPGISSCVSGGLGTGCFILTRAACNFQRTWFIPELFHSYEVSEITGHSCAYHISVKHIENNTVSRIVLTDSAYTDTGVKITVLGAYDQPQIHLSDSLVQRVGRPMESYLVPVSKRNHPKAGEIGAIQANQSFTKEFIFDPKISTCDFFEDRLRCNTVKDPLLQLSKSQEYVLPMERDMHLFKIQDGKLVSSLLVSSAVRLQLHFQNFKIRTKTTTICPKINDSPIEVKGCYKCPVLARLTISAHSTCQAGVVVISFQDINVHSKAVRLSTDPTFHTIKFVGENKCYSEKICLKAQTLIQCKQIDFCLEEPSVELSNLNTNYTIQASIPTSNKWWDWIQLPSMGSSLFFLKLLGSTLFIICLLITTLSTIVTCCCKYR